MTKTYMPHHALIIPLQEAWFEALIERTTVVDTVVGGMSAVIAALLCIFFDELTGINSSWAASCYSSSVVK